MRIDSPSVSNLTFQAGAEVADSSFTGSFSGSFTGVGNFTGLTADSVDYDNVTNKPTLVSSSAQINADSVTNFDSNVKAKNDTDLVVSGSATNVRSFLNVEDGADVTDTTNVKSSLNASLGGAATFGDSSDTITIPGNLTVTGTKTELQVTNLNVEDLNITVASGSADAAAANGAGLTVDGASATLTYASTGDKWVFNKDLDLGSNNLTTSGNVDGVDVSTLKSDFDTLNGKTLVSGSSIASSAQGEVALTTNGVAATAVDLGLQTSDDVQFNSLGVGTAGSTTTGEIIATNDITAFYSSDERLKENIVDLEGALDKVKAMRGVTFDWKELSEEERKTIHSHEGHDLGVIAQEVQAVYPELVHQRDHGYLSVDYVKLTAVLIQAVKELSAKVDELSK